MGDPLLWEMFLFWFLGICGGIASSIGDAGSPSLPLRRVCGKSFAGGMAGVCGGLWFLRSSPADKAEQYIAAIAAGFLGPFIIWQLIRLKYGINGNGTGIGADPKAVNFSIRDKEPPGDKP